MTKTSFENLRFDQIRLDGNTQPRVQMDSFIIDEYAETYSRSPDIMPPLDVMFDGASYWLYDGFHRRWGAERAGLQSVRCRILQGTQQDAQWASYQMNQAHGLRRSRADKELAIKRALRHPDGRGMSDSHLANYLGASDKTVAKFRAELESTSEIPKLETKIGRDGKKRRRRRKPSLPVPTFVDDVPAAKSDVAPVDDPAAATPQPVAPVDIDRLCPACEVGACVVGQDRCEKCIRIGQTHPDDLVVAVDADDNVVAETTKPEAPRLSKGVARQMERRVGMIGEHLRAIARMRVPEGHAIALAIGHVHEAYLELYKAIQAERNQ